MLFHNYRIRAECQIRFNSGRMKFDGKNYSTKRKSTEQSFTEWNSTEWNQTKFKMLSTKFFRRGNRVAVHQRLAERNSTERNSTELYSAQWNSTERFWSKRLIHSNSSRNFLPRKFWARFSCRIRWSPLSFNHRNRVQRFPYNKREKWDSITRALEDWVEEIGGWGDSGRFLTKIA